MLQLRPYQQQAVAAIIESLRAGKHPVCALPTGSGKSVVLAELCNCLDGRVLVVTHRRELIQQNESTLMRMGADSVGTYSAGLGRREMGTRIVFAGVASIYKRMYQLQEYGSFRYVLVDEAHYGLSDRSGNTMHDQVLQQCHAAQRVGFSATPYRLPDIPIWGDNASWFDELCTNVSILELTEQGYLARLVGVQTASSPKLDHVRTRGGDYAIGDLSQASSEEDVVNSACDEVLYLAQDRKHILIFCVDVMHAAVVADALRERGCAPEVVVGTTPSQKRDDILDRFKAGKIRHLISVNTLNVGFDSPNVDCVVLLRATMSKSLCLDSETEILTSHGWMGMGQIQVGDCVPAMNMQTYKGEWATVLSTIERQMEPDEYWIGYDAPRASFRVTDGHTMLFKKKFNKRGTNRFAEEDPWLVDKASEMYKIKDTVYVPTAVEIEMPGVPLSDHELYFIGMVLTDGTVTSSSVVISQSERHPEIIERIRECLNRCGFKYYERKRPLYRSDVGSYPQRHDRWTFTVGIGSRRKADGSSPNIVHKRESGQYKTEGVFHDGRGCGYLMPYLDKDFPALLFSMTKRQFLALLRAIDDGDGYKVAKCASVDWTPKGWTICSARREFIERLQALAAIHGFTGHVRLETGERKNPIWKITITPQSWRSMHGPGQDGVKRPKIYRDGYTEERVWCIETTSGTIITRRKGKVTVMGNCVQMLGRASRLHPSKTDALILDAGGNLERHRPIDGLPKVLRSPKLAETQEQEKRERRQREERERKVRHDAMVARGIDPLSTERIDESDVLVMVTDVSYKLKPASKYPGRMNLMVFYKGIEPSGRARSVTQFVLLDYPGRPGLEAGAWFERRGLVKPVDAKRALSLAWKAPRPEAIVVERQGEWDHVVMEQFRES